MKKEKKESPAKSPGLAAYAIPAKALGNRRHEEIPRSIRPDFKRDRDRLLRAKAFLQLDQKTEIFLNSDENGNSDLAPSRLLYTTHTTSTARVLAERLHLNEEVTEAVALARALGEPAFGRAGAATLHTLMSRHGGFDAAAQSLRIVDELEMKYPEFNGLNLSSVIRESLKKESPSLETQAALWAKRITSACLDLEWGLEAGLLDETQLATCELWQEVSAPIRKQYGKLETGRRRNYTVRNLISHLVEQLVEHSIQVIEKNPRLGFNAKTTSAFEALEKQMNQAVRHAAACEVLYRDRAACLKELFAIYIHHPHLLGECHSFRLKKDGVHRVVTDFLAHSGDKQLLRLRHEFVGERSPGIEQARQSMLL